MLFFKRIFLFLLLVSLASCQLMPNEPRDIWAPELNFSKVKVGDFYLLVATNRHIKNSVLNVYIEGDGTPWVNRYFVAKDPGPYGRLALDLMRQDPHAAFYLGRPCYYSWQLPLQTKCSPIMWTGERYSAQVVDLMSSALQEYLDQNQFEKINLIGHSGGGTLAYLIAQKVEAVSGVIIIAGNLDVDAWTKHHSYTKLRGSINPAKLTNRKNLPVIYLAGEKDRVVPLHTTSVFLKKIGAKIIVRADYDHVCCWRNEWSLLNKDLLHLL
jgi:predicted alpha/beta hydrolase family esterase